MEKILLQIARLLLESIPTVLFIFFVFFLLDRLLFRPIVRVLTDRERMTRGAREQAEIDSRQADEKAQEYENALQQIQRKIYQRRQKLRKEIQAEQEIILKETRDRAETLLRKGQLEIERQVTGASKQLLREREALAQHISEAVLNREVPS